MSMIPPWLGAEFGCILRESAAIQSLMRTELSSGLPQPVVSAKADPSAGVRLGFELDLDNAQFAAWQQWTTYDIYDGSLPFNIPIPWGTTTAHAHARLTDSWRAVRIDSLHWSVSGVMEIERASLPRFSGGINA